MSAQEGDRAAWERDVLAGFVAAMPPTGEAPDYIAALTGVMLHARVEQEGAQGEAVALVLHHALCSANHRAESLNDAVCSRAATAVAPLLAAVPVAGDEVQEAKITAARRELCDTSHGDALRVSRALIVLGDGGVDLLAALDRDRRAPQPQPEDGR